MITWLLGTVVKAVFLAVVITLRGIFGKVWTDLAGYVTTMKSLEGVGVGVKLFDMFVGIDFIVWATGFALFIVITIRIVRLILGVFSKAA
jgi:hypothetical protein